MGWRGAGGQGAALVYDVDSPTMLCMPKLTLRFSLPAVRSISSEACCRLLVLSWSGLLAILSLVLSLLRTVRACVRMLCTVFDLI